MSWKKILFLCLSFTFVFGGVFGFENKSFAQYGPLPTLENSNRQDINYANSQVNSAKTEEEKAQAQAKLDAAKAEQARLASEQEKARQAAEKAEQARLASEQEKARQAAEANGAGIECGVGNWLNLYCWAAKFSNEVILTGAYLVAGVGGYLFDNIINFSVIEMGKNIKTGNGDYISEAWKIMRDVINIAFIFVLLYIGIMTIIKGFESGTSKMIATVVVVALIINFSLFFTKIIIDGSNIIAINFYNTIKAETPSSTGKWSGVAGAFLNVLQLGTIQSQEILAIKEKGGDDKFLNIIKVSIGGTIILLVLAIVLFIASLMFVTRYIILIFVLIASSAAIGSWILPSLKKSIYDKWWGALIGQAFLAPVFLFFLFISLKMTEGMTSSLLQSKNMKWSEIFTGDGAAIAAGIDLIISYLIVVGFLVGSIIISKSLSNMAGSGAGKITGFMGGAALGAAGFAGRNTVGRLGQTAANSTALQNFAAKSRVGMGLLNVSNKVAKGSYDARGTKTFGAMGVDMGKTGGEGGFQKSMTEAVKKRKDQYATSGELNDNEKIEKNQMEKYLEDNSKTERAAIEKEQKKIKEQEKILKGLDPTSAAAQTARNLIKGSETEIERQKKNIESITDKNGNNIHDQIEKINDSGKLRQESYLKAVGNRWMKSNKIAAAEIRAANKKKANMSDVDKIIAGIKTT